MKNKKIAASLLAVSMLATSVLAGCDKTGDSSGSSGANSGSNSGNSGSNPNSGSQPDLKPEDAAWEQTLKYADSTTLRMACGYNNDKTGMRFASSVAGEGVKLADGKTYHTGDFKPTWNAVMEKLKFKIEDGYTGKSASEEWKVWQEKLDQIDMVGGNAAALSAAGTAGQLLNIADYLDSMPYFNSYLERNPIVRLSITGSTTGTNEGAIYFSPYFDGVNDIERMPLMRTDWVVKLLDGPADASDITESGNTKAVAYQPYMPTSSSVEVEVVKKDGSGTEKIKKDYSKYGNIVAKMNEIGSMSGKDAVKMLREYIDKTYSGYYGETRSDLFIGQNAAWDADELVALLRCVISNAKTLNGTDKIQGIFTRDDSENQRRMDMFRFCGTLFGIRGLESRQDYLYVDKDGKLRDARMEEDTYKAFERMNAMVKEGLISESFVNKQKEDTKSMLKNDLGFMHYDYNQTQTVYNDQDEFLQDGEEYRAAMVPVAIWNDGTGNKYMRFTESWRSVKTDGWAISLAGIGYTKDNVPKKASELNDKAKALLTLIDYAYSREGQILMSYGPAAFIDGDKTFEFNGKQWPVISEQNAKDLWSLAGGNYTNYARQYIGSTLSFVKSQAFEYQCTTEAGKKGAGYISKAIALGTIKHPELAIAENQWYTSVPTVLPNTSAESTSINGYKDLTTQFSSQKTEKGGNNIICDLISQGMTLDNFKSTSEAVTTVSNKFGGAKVLELKQAAWDRLQKYYNEKVKK